MGTVDLLLVVVLVSASALCGVAVWALIDGVRTSRSVRALSDDTRERLVPLLEKADVTVDALNAELLRVDAIITQVEQASDRVSHASETITEIVNAPAEIVNNVAGAVRRAWKDKRAAQKAPAEQGGERSEPREDQSEPSEVTLHAEGAAESEDDGGAQVESQATTEAPESPSADSTPT